MHLSVEAAFYKKVSIMSENIPNIEVITSNRGNIMLIYKNFKFIHAYTSKDGITRWRCYEKKCTAKIFTKTNYVLVKVEGSHAADHSAIDRRLIDRQIINSACKRKAVEDVSMRPKKIILREIGQSVCTNISVKDVDRVRKNMYESRRKILPANPTSIQSVHDSLRDMNILTMQDKKTETYIYMLQKITELCDNMGRLFLPTNITSDFEKAILNAIYEVWPRMNVVG
ncbi:uncharacterized protein LOC111041611 [Myzus persicae]|uniref:uncharacterized protein LOC111041611 n=1 Tax=Myzus persicae TaxID=13164 RepID=UPI000B937C68|nr:uncharacterized protein LOC111041611 [Myzus persicae]